VQKFVEEVEQITFSGDYALQKGTEVVYITERAVFKLTPEGLALTEVAPGIDIQRDIFAHMAFRPNMPVQPKIMDHRIFIDKIMRVKDS